MEPIVLASTSPRRQEILKELGIPFRVMTPDYDEPEIPGLAPESIAELHSMKKLESVMRSQVDINAPWILGADTLISLDGKVYGKPSDRDDAERMLRDFSGRTHSVITGISLFDAKINFISSRTSISTVTFMKLNDTQINRYLETGEWQGVAGAYRIQGLAACFIERIEGSWSGIVGLPIHDLYAILREHGYEFTV